MLLMCEFLKLRNISASPYHSAFQYYSYTLRGAAFGGLYAIINFQSIQKPAKEAGNLFPQIFGEMSLHTKTIISQFSPLSMVKIKSIICQIGILAVCFSKFVVAMMK